MVTRWQAEGVYQSFRVCACDSDASAHRCGGVRGAAGARADLIELRLREDEEDRGVRLGEVVYLAHVSNARREAHARWLLKGEGVEFFETWCSERVEAESRGLGGGGVRGMRNERNEERGTRGYQRCRAFALRATSRALG